jgi:hypothetical protein
LSQYDYVLVEGQVKCKGCVQIWPDRISTGPLVESSVLVVCGDMETFNQFRLNNGVAYITKLDSINNAFPYSANYFLFYRRDGEFDSYVELGAREIAIPESLR